MKRIKSVAALLLALALVFVMAACAGGGKTNLEKYNFKSFDKEQPINILILGNSFIWTSNVERPLKSILEENGVQATVDWQAKGYWRVQLHYDDIFGAKDELPLVKAGYYDVIILQTIYDFTDARYVANFVEELESRELSTRIVLFPAENEASYSVEYAKTNNRDVGLANWQGLIHKLWYQEGFPQNSLAMPDEIRHANELAGYAGAVLLYCRLFGELPQTQLEDGFMIEAYDHLIPGLDAEEKLESLEVIRTSSKEIIDLYDNYYAEIYAGQDSSKESGN